MTNEATGAQINYALVLARRARLDINNVAGKDWGVLVRAKWCGKGYTAALVFAHQTKAEMSVIIDTLKRWSA